MMCTALQRLTKAYMRHLWDCAEDKHTKKCRKMVLKGEEYPVNMWLWWWLNFSCMLCAWIR